MRGAARGDERAARGRGAAAAEDAGRQEESGGPRAAKEAELHAIVGRAAALANAQLLDLLLGKYELRAHVANLQRFLLLGKGDFAQALMEHIAPQLSRPASQLHRHHLLSLVESAVRTSAPMVDVAAAEAEQTLLLKHLDVSLTKAPGGSGWEAFALDYQLGAPCDAIFSVRALAEYRRIFTFLWRLKRVEHSLSAVWRKHCTTARLLARVLGRDPTMHGCYLLRNEMVHFVYNLQYYLMFEVIEGASLQLAAKLAAASSLDDLLSAHSHFLASIVQKAMLRDVDEEMAHALKELFDTILRFARAQERLSMTRLEHAPHAVAMCTLSRV